MGVLQSLNLRGKPEFLVLVNKAPRKIFGCKREKERERERERERK